MSGNPFLLLLQCLVLAYRLPLEVREYRTYSEGSYAVCPRCNASLDREYMAYCACCGQRLGWRLLDAARVDAERR